MFSDADADIEKIVSLVAKCPERFQDKCFEMLLAAYLAGKARNVYPNAGLPASSANAATPAENSIAPAAEAQASKNAMDGLPEQLRTRFVAMAGRLRVPLGRLSGLFDFHLDPYNFHALVVPGENNAEKCRNVALLLCAKSYLMMSGWQADWKEFRAVCLDQGCFDKANTQTSLNKSGWFRSCSAADGIAASPQGIAAAETLLSQLAGGGENQ
jgi:hypothetical protein